MSVARFLDTLKAKSHADVDEWQSEMLVRALRKARVKLFSPLMRSRPDDCAVSAVRSVLISSHWSFSKSSVEISCLTVRLNLWITLKKLCSSPWNAPATSILP